MLGDAVYAQLRKRYHVNATDINLIEPWLSYLDVRDLKSVKKVCAEFKPDYLIHLAALTDMEYCETHPEEAAQVNGTATENLVKISKKLDIPFVYISTAGIFTDDKKEHSEKDDPKDTPVSVYGKTKYQGEVAAKSWRKSIIIRAGWMMGGGPKKDKKFINKIVKQLSSGATKINVVNDRVGTPSYTYDLAKIIVFLLERNLYGLYHGTCDGGNVTRHDVVSHILECFNLQDKVKVVEVGSDYFKDSFFAPRPFSEQLGNKKLKSTNPELFRSWRDCLKEYLGMFYWKVSGNHTPLCDLAYKYGTDKCPEINHSYTPFYYKLLQPKRNSIKKILEIGIGYPSNMNHIVPHYRAGASLYMWREFFPNAMIYGADILPEALFKDAHIETFLCNQKKDTDLTNLIKSTGSDIDIVIDDGSHVKKVQVFTCLILLPLLKKDVIYIIEDVKDAVEVTGMIKKLGGYDCEVPKLNPERQVRQDCLVIVKNK